MSPSRFAHAVLASAMLAAAALAAAPEALRAQIAKGPAAHDRELRTSRSVPARGEQYRRMQREPAHAQSPDTMYASTPDTAPPPHPAHVATSTKGAPESSGPPSGMPVRSGERRTYRIGLFPSASDALGRQGFARVVNRSESEGDVEIVAWDDEGTERGPLTLTIGPGETKHFNSDHLEGEETRADLSGSTGAGEGSWRLDLTSTLDLEVLSYIRTGDGFLTSMHDFAPRTGSGHRVVTFNPGRNANQVSSLRLVNPGGESAQVRIEGVDDAGVRGDSVVTLSLAGGASRTVSAVELESGEGLSGGGLGKGKGKWRLAVSSEQPIEVMSVLSTPTGHLTNLSTIPHGSETGEDGVTTTHRIGLFPSASDALGRQGFARVVNRSESEGDVEIVAWDDEGTERGPLTLTIGPGETKHFNSDHLEGEETRADLSGSTGAGEGSWRLDLTSTLDLEVLSYIRTGDGFLTSMHDFAPRTGSGHRVVTFNPGRNANQVSSLRLVNPGGESAQVRIEGVDDAGVRGDSVVTLSLAGGASRTVSAVELESGEGLSGGGLGKGKGKWRLAVSSEQPIEVMSVLSTPTGHLTNLSTVPGPAAPGETAADVFREHISGPVVQAKCVACHVAGGIYPGERLVFVRSSDPGHETHNLQGFKDFVADVPDGANVVLDKIRGGRGHGGGSPVPSGTPDYENMQRFLRLLGEDIKPVTLTPRALFDTVTPAPLRKTLRRAALILAGRTPSDGEYAAVQRAGAARETIRGLMTGPEFHDFLIRAANDRLLTNRAGQVIDANFGHYVDFTNETWRRKKKARESGDHRELSRYYLWNDRTQHGFRRAPLELIAHVVENDLPYTEILTADYIMANPWSAAAYGASTRFDDPDDVHEFKPSEIVSYYRKGDGYESRYDSVVQSERVFDPGPLITDYPHAGILNTAAFLYRYPTTATNRNRARSRWTWYHFLGLDIEKSASRTTDPDALADTNNPTLLNPACTVCHRVLDPTAGTFQNYGDEGFYKDKWGGIDSIDDFYRNEAGTSLEIRADSWRNRETLSWSLPLSAGTQTLRVVFANDFYERDTGLDGNIFLDRMSVTDARGRSIHGLEFENLEAPVAHWGRCGQRQYNQSTGRHDHFMLWGGYVDCAFYIDVSVPSAGVHDVEIVAWSNGRYAQFGGDGYARLAVAVNAYRQGDTWYRDMRVPGFGGETAPDSDNSVQWLAKRIVADDRFAEATVKFWWPAIMGSEVAEPPEDEADADFEGLLLAANAQGAEVARLARGFRSGFAGGSPYNLRDLLVELVLSKWFRADTVEDTDPVRRVALRDAGARRLLTPEELSRKTAALTGVEWGRHIRINCWPECERRPSALAGDFRLLYGGIDSGGITERARDITSVMAGVVRRHAVQSSCLIVMRELYLLPDADRRLFAGIDQYVTPPRGAGTIRNKLVELHDKLLGVQVTPHSPDVEAAYRLFVDVVTKGPRSRDDWFNTYGWFAHWECDWWSDLFLFEGILEDVLVVRENEDGWQWYEYDHPRVRRFLDRQDWSDPHHVARAWVVVLSFLMSDYRYLYL